MQNILKIIFVILGTIIGAGFISGQEINLFFNKYGNEGIIGILFAGIIIGIVIKKTCIIIKEKNIKKYSELIKEIIPFNNKKIRLILNNIINIFLIISFFIMSAALNAYFYQEFKIPIFITGIINSFICYFIFIKNGEAIIKINQILMPIILLSIILLFFKNNTEIIINKIKINENLFLAIFNGIIYSCYNVILLIPILTTLNKYYTSIKQIKIISFICSFVIIIISLIIYFLLNNLNNINEVEIPIIYIANFLGEKFYYIYSFIILIAIFTTEISVGFGFLKNEAISYSNYKILAIIICISSIFISYIGFSNLVNILYPLFGILGITQIFFLLKY